MTDISGPFGETLSASADRLSSLASRSLQQSLSAALRRSSDLCGSTLWRLIWKVQVTPLGRRFCRLQALVPLISESGFGSSEPAEAAWPTPCAMETGESPESILARNQRQRDRGVRIGTAMSLSARVQQIVASPWATPAARDYKDGGSDGTVPINALLGRQAWLAAAWQTPRAPDGSNGGPNQTGGALSAHGAMPLGVWPTPTQLDRPRSPETRAKSAAFRKRNANQNTVPLYLGEVAALGMPPNGFPAETAKPGQLNPAFSLWLQGYPPQWMALAPSRESASSVDLATL